MTITEVTSEVQVVIIKVDETQGVPGPQGPKGEQGDPASVPPNISYFNNDVGYITKDSTEILVNKTWHGVPIEDAYILNSAIWNAKQNDLGYVPENLLNKGAANGYCPLNEQQIIPSLFLPAYVDDILEYQNPSYFPGNINNTDGKDPLKGTIYVSTDAQPGPPVVPAGASYRWTGTSYSLMVASPGSTDNVPEGSVNLYYKDTRVNDFLLSWSGTESQIKVGTVTTGIWRATSIEDAYIASAGIWNAKQGALPPGGTPAQYLRGDYSLATFPVNVSSFNNDAQYIKASEVKDSNFAKGGTGVDLDGRGVILTTGQKGYARIAYNGIITEWSLIAEPSTGGTLVFDVWKVNNAYPTIANSITPPNAKPFLTNENFRVGDTLTWTNRTVQAGDMFGWNLDSVSLITGVILQLTITKT